MAAIQIPGPWSHSLGSALSRLRERGQSTIQAALAPAPLPPRAELPGLVGEALARHHIALAVAALSKPGKSKPEVFRELRLLINAFEQLTGRPQLQPAAVDERPALPPMSRRARLVNRAFESANAVAAWRAPKPMRDSQQHAR